MQANISVITNNSASVELRQYLGISILPNVMASSTPPLAVLLAERILEAVTKLEQFNGENGHKRLCFNAGGSSRPPLPADLRELVDSAQFALDRLTALLSGPEEWLRLQYGRGVR
jgi:hypothetical protein